jgi:hypothetical protein
MLRAELVAAAGVAATLVGVGVELVELAVAGAAAAVAGGAFWLARRLRATQLTRALRGAVALGGGRDVLFDRVADVVGGRWPLAYALLVAWDEDGTGGRVEATRGRPDVPDPEVMSWLLRELESGDDLIVDDGPELRRSGTAVALPLRRENSALVGFVVLGGTGHAPGDVLDAARGALRVLGLAFADAPGPGERASDGRSCTDAPEAASVGAPS